MSGTGLSMPAVLESAFNYMLKNAHTALPGVIEKYDAATCKADVTPSLRKRWEDGTQVDMPVLIGVPVVWPRTSQGAITMPLEKGDGVLLVFSERSLDNWKGRGGVSDQTNPRCFDLSDAIAVPGLYSFKERVQEANTTELQIRFGKGKLTISKDGSVVVDCEEMKIGKNAFKKIVDQRIVTYHNAHVHALNIPGGTTLVPTVLMITDNVASSKARVE